MKSYAFLFWGYAAVWAGLTIYLIALGRRLSRVSRRLDALERRGGGRDGSAT
ncbi:MAG TPA: CcmD family protein [Candidatus Polarisedimenticolaceae bacterium]|nr:CcmD family protein [Candidatus Polarisedimenticolaceae bacterium]